MRDTLEELWDWTRETIETTRIHHYLALGMASLWILMEKGGAQMMHAICISTLFFVCLITFVMMCVGISYLCKMLKTKAGRKEIQAKIDDLEHFIGDVKDDITNDDMTIQSASDEGLRRMAKLQKDQHTAKLNKFEAEIQTLKAQLSK